MLSSTKLTRMTLISIRLVFLSSLFMCLFMLSCDSVENETNKAQIKQVNIDEEKEKLLKKFYSQDDASLSQLKDYLFHDVELLKQVLPHEGKYSLWSRDSLVLPRADTLLKLLGSANHYGLQPHWYHHQDLLMQRHLLDDSLHRSDPSAWTKFEVMMSNAFVGFAQDIRYGRLKADSIDQRDTKTIQPAMLTALVDSLASGKNLSELISSLEPRHEGYHAIKKMLATFLPSMKNNRFTVVVFPWRDSLTFLQQIHRRLSEEGFTGETAWEDSIKMATAVKKAQEKYGLKKDGKPGKLLVAALNDWDLANYARMAINLDRYRIMPDSMPESYVMVNIPSYTLEARYKDTLVFASKVIVGKAKTRSPLLNARFSNIVVYPQWNVPESIVYNEIIPKMQKNLFYLQEQNMVVLDKRDSIVDPATIHWATANKNNFRYRIRQGEGLDNSLGIIKFNFSNPYAVYLHDTNARSLFKLDERSLSHGCIRVEKWQQMADFLSHPMVALHTDTTIHRLLKQEKKATRLLKDKVYLFVRYFTLFQAGETTHFYPDIYGEDNLLIDNYLY